MSHWFYYDTKGQKIGPVDTATLRTLAKNGIIQRETFLENVNGRRGQAGTIKGLEFVEPPSSTPPPVPVPKPVTNTPIQTNSHLQSSKPSNAVNWRHWQKGTWTIVIATGLAVLSFILPWKDIGFITINGFRQGTFLLGILFIYPVWASASNRSLNSIAGYACAVVGIVLGIVFYFHCSVQLFDSKNNFAGMGVYTFLGSCVVLAIGVFLYRPVEVALDEQVKNVGVKPLSNGGVFQNPMITAVLGFFVGLLVMFGISNLMAEYGSKTKSGKIDFNFFGSDEDNPFSSDAPKLSPQEEIKYLEEKKAEVEKLKQFRIMSAKFYYSEDAFQSNRPMIELAVKNTSDTAVSKVGFHGKLTSPGRSVPWVEEDFSYEISGGIESNEEETWSLRPNMFGSWSKAPENRDDFNLDVTVKSLTFADGKEIRASTFTEDESKKLEELKKSTGKK